MTEQEWQRYREIWETLAPQIKGIANRPVEIHYGNCVRGVYRQGNCPPISSSRQSQILALADDITFRTRRAERPLGYPCRVTYGPIMEAAWEGIVQPSMLFMQTIAAQFQAMSSSSSSTTVPPWWPPTWPKPWPPYPTPPIPIPPMCPIAEDRRMIA